MMANADRHLYAACPLCEGKDLQLMVTADWSSHPLYAHTAGRLSPKMHWKTCRTCAHVFTDGYFTPEAFAILMGASNEGQVLGKDYEQQRVVSARMIERVLPYADWGTWLDVGFGNGSLLMTAQEFGFDVVGCDLRPVAVEAIRSVGIEAHCQDITQLKLPGPCRVISMADVLEHIPYPKQALQAAHRMLQDGGILFLSMPNSESVTWDLQTRANTNSYWWEVEHYHNFSRSRLCMLLEETGFRPMKFGISERYRMGMELVAQKQ